MYLPMETFYVSSFHTGWYISEYTLRNAALHLAKSKIGKKLIYLPGIDKKPVFELY